MKKIWQILGGNKNIFTLAENISVKVFGFACFLILVRNLDTGDFGVWILYLTAATLMEMLRDGLIHTGLVRFATGKEKSDFDKVVGSSWIIGLLITAICSFSVYSLASLYPDSRFSVFFIWFPALFIASLPHSSASWILHARERFDTILALKVIVSGSFLVILLSIFIRGGHTSVTEIAIAHIIANLVGSAYALLSGNSEISSIGKGRMKTVKELFHFGKYTMGTLIASNLLKSSDLFLIGWFAGPSLVAFYTVPIKFTELIEIPLRSFAATSLPVISNFFHKKDFDGVKKVFTLGVGMLSLFLFPFLVVSFLFADQVIIFLGGVEYLEASNILRIFICYSLFLPIDRYIGITLDSINRPEINFKKVSLMVTVNIIGDIIALKTVGLSGVAAVTILSIVVGVIFGIIMLKRCLNDNCKPILEHICFQGKGSKLNSLFLYDSKGNKNYEHPLRRTC